MALTDQIAADGDAPWCIGIESGAATGWAMTDWIEEMMLRTTTPENYDKWVAGELKFDSPEVRKAVDIVTKIWFNDGYVYGGRKAIATTSFGDAPKPMFEKPPKCWLHQPGQLHHHLLPRRPGGRQGLRLLLPACRSIPAYGKPVLVAGDIYAMFNDRPEVRAVMQYFSTGASVEGWVKAGGAISPHKDVEPGLVQRPRRPQGGRDHPECHRLPLRWLGPDAGRGRRRHLLEVHDLLRQWLHRPGHRPQGDRRLLAEVSSG